MCLAYFYYSNKAIFQCSCCVLSSCTSLTVITVFNYTIIYKYIQNLHENTQNKTLTLRHGAGRMYVIQLYFRKQLAGLASIQEARLRSVIFTDKGGKKNQQCSKNIMETKFTAMDDDVVAQNNNWKNTKEAVANFRKLLVCSKW